MSTTNARPGCGGPRRSREQVRAMSRNSTAEAGATSAEARATSRSSVTLAPLESTAEYVERRLRDASFVFLPNRSRRYAFAKRVLDIIGAVTLGIVTLPII